MKYGLLIQGPLLSYGRTGKNVLELLHDATLIHFDCRETIRHNIDSYGDLFDQIVVSTWDDHIFPDFNIEKGELLRLLDNTRRVEDRKARRHWKNKDVPNNMLRQFYGTYQGLIEFKDIDYVVRIRTDQTLDLAALIRSLGDNDKIKVAHVIRGSNVLADFYFAGRLNVMRELFSVLSRPDFISQDPHKDIVLRYAREKYFHEIGVDVGWYNDYATSKSSKIFAYMLNNVFSPLPRNIYESVIWRGEPFCEEYRQQFDGLCFDYPDLYPQECACFRFEDALFRSRANPAARYIQKTLRRMLFVAMYVYEHTFK